jgi:hypothetical protein
MEKNTRDFENPSTEDIIIDITVEAWSKMSQCCMNRVWKTLLSFPFCL